MKRPEKLEMYIPLDVQEAWQPYIDEFCKKEGIKPNRSAYVVSLIRKDMAAKHIETLFALAKRDPESAERKIMGALDAKDGNATEAREVLGAKHGDWDRAVGHLNLGDKIAARWPARRASQMGKGKGNE